MGDHRATLKATLVFHGHTYTYNSGDINWVHGASEVWFNEWLDDAVQDGLDRYQIELEALYARENQAKTEAAERAELARLKAKYEGGVAEVLEEGPCADGCMSIRVIGTSGGGPCDCGRVEALAAWKKVVGGAK